MSASAITVSHISKVFHLNTLKEDSLKEAGMRWLKYGFGQKKMLSKPFYALKDISFQVEKGEVVSIIGDNGAGKSTLLKIISHIMKPTSGRIELHGKVSALLEVGTGFHAELSGRENIFFNGYLLGMKRREIKAKFDQIVAFSGIEDFLEIPIKYYSNGMKIRLGFSVAAFLEPDIFLLDEVLMVGDAEFKRRSIQKIKEIARESGASVLFVSHNLGAVREVCQRGILLKDGKVQHFGEINHLIDLYEEKVHQKVEQFHLQSSNPLTVEENATQEIKWQKSQALSWENPTEMIGNEWVKVSAISLYAKDTKTEDPIVMEDILVVEIHFFKLKKEGILDVTLQWVDGKGEIFMVTSSAFTEEIKGKMNMGTYTAKCEVPGGLLNSGIFYLDLLFHENKRKKAVFRKNRLLYFEVQAKKEEFGIMYRRTSGPIRPLFNWTVKESE